MKNTLPKKKKPTKTMDDSIAETISFVIKGHLTPLKPTPLPKKAYIDKHKLSVAKGTSTLKKGVAMKSKKVKEKVTQPRVVKKLNKQLKCNTKDQKGTSKRKKIIIPPRRISQQNMLGVLNTLVLSDVHRGDIGNSLLVNHAANKIKTELPKLVKKIPKDAQNAPAVKLEDVKDKKIKPATPKTKPETTKKPKQNINQKKANKILISKTQTKTVVGKKAELAKKPVKVRRDCAKPKLPKKTPNTTKIKKEVILHEKKPLLKKVKPKIEKPMKAKIKPESSDDTSDEVSLDVLRQLNCVRTIKKEVDSDSLIDSKETVSTSKLLQPPNKKSEKVSVKNKINANTKKPIIKKRKTERKEDSKTSKLKLYSFWNGPKRHRVASLNALAKVHCLYENETRGAIFDNDSLKLNIGGIKKEVKTEPEDSDKEEIPKRSLRSVPGLRGVGKHYDILEALTSSEENDSSDGPESDNKHQILIVDKKPEIKRPAVKRRRKQCELIMDLKDMVVRKRMASLNASAILAASYSLERRATRSPKSETTESDDSGESFKPNGVPNKKKVASVVEVEEPKIIEVQTTPSKKVSVIVNQDTDVTITGVYVNSTTRSTHHEGFCSIAGMQYLISAKSHTQTASTTVATEAIMQSTSSLSADEGSEEALVQPSKSYTPLGALSNMQPPGPPSTHGIVAGPSHVQHATSQHVLPMPASQNIPHTSPMSRRHHCQSAFSSPPIPYETHPLPAHHHHRTMTPLPPRSASATSGDPVFIQGYYQPAGPLINVPQHGHPQPLPPQPIVKTVAHSETSLSPTSPRPIQSQSSATDSVDSDVIITSVTNVKESQSQPQIHPLPPPPTYRYAPYPSTHHSYAYGYAPQYYPGPPPSGTLYHHDLCYSPTTYLHHKGYPPHAYRRHLTPPTSNQYYSSDVYRTQPPSTPTQQNQPAVTATPTNAYQPSPNGPPHQLVESYPPPPTLVEPYPSPHYYPGLGSHSCYSHSPASRAIPYLDAAYQTCPCPIEPCPKNVHTGPLTGDSKRSGNMSSLVKESLPLPPVALALPLEPVSATGPPSPARGSAGMPPPPSPAGATYQPAQVSKQDEVETLEVQPVENPRKARVGKNMVRNNIAANFPENTMLLMCHPHQNTYIASVKREIESPEQQIPSKNISVTLNKEHEDSASTKVCSSIESPTINTSSPVTDKESISEITNNIEEIESLPKKCDPKDESLEELLPCQKTVAENVKVKNMKRKLPEVKEIDESESLIPTKIQKVDSKGGGSYKDLIKKNVSSIKINNGKRKLIGDRIYAVKKSSHKIKQIALKHKLKTQKSVKRLKLFRPLGNNHIHNFKNRKNGKRQWRKSLQLQQRTLFNSDKKKPKNINNNDVSKKSAPAVLDSLFAKNNVDRTIEYVVSGFCEPGQQIKSESLLEIITCGSSDIEVNPKEQELDKSNTTNSKIESTKSKSTSTKHIGAKKRKSTNSSSSSTSSSGIYKVPRKSIQCPRWSNGWTWKGEPFQGKVFLNSDDNIGIRKCYPAMIHTEGDVIEPRDCVLLKAGPRKNDLPFVAKVASLWENPDDGEMMISLLWYYRPEHTEHGRQPHDAIDEVFASRHKDTNSVACIEDKCYVLTFNEYCRYRKALKRLEVGIPDPVSCIPMPEPYPRKNRLPPSHMQTPMDLVFFCRKVYDFRQKRIIKNPS